MKFGNKRCPRCRTRMPIGLATCPSCSLNFQKFDGATNKEAKEAIKNGEREQVLMRKGCPVDVARWKLLLITIFLGFTGAHYYYVGRTKMGIFFTSFFFVGIINAIVTTMVKRIPHNDFWEIFSFLVLIWGIVLMLWIVDIAKVCLNHFKIPVSRSK